jgi:hypothetical protein
MQATPVTAAQTEKRAEKRDWVAWYDDLLPGERKEIRDRLLHAAYEEVKADAELRQFFFFHSEDVVADEPPGVERLTQLHAILHAMRGAGDDPELAEKRRKAVGFLLAEYQRFLRDNPWAC